MNKEQQQIIDEAYENYENAYYKGQAFGYKKLNDNEFSPDLKMLKEEFINKIKTDTEFSETWGLKIEERELSLEERQNLYFKLNPEFRLVHENMNKQMDNFNTPTKLITLTYNNEKIESYE